MDEHAKKMMRELMMVPGISGYEERARKHWAQLVRPWCDEQFTDVNGSEIATLRGASAKTRILLMGHIDQLGLLVKYIDDNGFLYFAPVGSIDNPTLVSQRVKVLGPKGDVPGIIGKAAIHLTPRGERNTRAVQTEDLWIDIGARSRSEAEEYAPIGTPVMVGEEFVELLNGRFAGRIDNRFGVFVITEVLRRLHARRKDLFPTIHAAATVQEETGLGEYGAGPVGYRLEPTAALAVDVNHAIDIPGVDKRLHGDARMGAGTIINVGVNASNRMVDAIKDAARGAGLAVQLEYNNARSYTDSDAMPATRAGIPSVYIGMPLRYMHNTVEMGQWSDIEAVIDVVMAYILSIKSDVDYTP